MLPGQRKMRGGRGGIKASNGKRGLGQDPLRECTIWGKRTTKTKTPKYGWLPRSEDGGNTGKKREMRSCIGKNSEGKRQKAMRCREYQTETQRQVL